MSENKKFPRFRVMARIEHIILLLSFTMLAITGLPQKWPDASWADAMIAAMGGIETTRVSFIITRPLFWCWDQSTISSLPPTVCL